MTRNQKTIEVVMVSQERRRRWSAEEKAALVRETYGTRQDSCRINLF